MVHARLISTFHAAIGVTGLKPCPVRLGGKCDEALVGFVTFATMFYALVLCVAWMSMVHTSCFPRFPGVLPVPEFSGDSVKVLAQSLL
jgi:hypothetical protein